MKSWPLFKPQMRIPVSKASISWKVELYLENKYTEYLTKIVHIKTEPGRPLKTLAAHLIWTALCRPTANRCATLSHQVLSSIPKPVAITTSSAGQPVTFLQKSPPAHKRSLTRGGVQQRPLGEAAIGSCANSVFVEVDRSAKEDLGANCQACKMFPRRLSSLREVYAKNVAHVSKKCCHNTPCVFTEAVRLTGLRKPNLS